MSYRTSSNHYKLTTTHHVIIKNMTNRNLAVLKQALRTVLTQGDSPLKRHPLRFFLISQVTRIIKMQVQCSSMSVKRIRNIKGFFFVWHCTSKLWIAQYLTKLNFCFPLARPNVIIAFSLVHPWLIYHHLLFRQTFIPEKGVLWFLICLRLPKSFCQRLLPLMFQLAL